ncbi:MAG: RDD family protein [Cyanobacteria bacterium CAN_BIN43]|nr:RDD family protein [Cyanobacteria bacterium CAN_BIN43]
MELFKKVTLLTPESVELEFILAGIGNRALALLIDNLLVLLGISFFWFFGTLFATQLVTVLSPDRYAVAVLWLVAIAFLGTFLISAGYFVLFETLRQGQTPGKRFAQIRVIRDDGRPVGLTQAVLRALLRPIDDTFFIVGAVLILFDQNEKRLGDLVAGTLVIQEERMSTKRSIALSDSAQSLARQLPALSDITQLQPDDFAVVREFLQRRDFLTAKARTDLSMNLARQTRTLVHLETIPAGVTSDQFLEAIYLAYQSGGT